MRGWTDETFCVVVIFRFEETIMSAWTSLDLEHVGGEEQARRSIRHLC